MPSQLVLRIASQLDPKGFVDVQRQISQFVSQMKDANNQTTTLQRNFRDLGTVLVGVFASSGLRGFINQAIESERIVTILANRFTLLGESGDEVAKSLSRLATVQSTVTRFSQTELLNALNVLGRNAKSSGEAIKELSIAQNIAAATGTDLSTASLALSRAQNGAGFFLARLTGLTASQIRAFQKEGTLLDELSTKFKGFAERDAKTLGGQLDILKNKFKNIGESIGEDVLPPVRLLVESLNKIPAPLVKTGLELAVLLPILGATGVVFGRTAKILADISKTAAIGSVAKQLVFPFVKATSVVETLGLAVRGLFTLISGPAGIALLGGTAILGSLNLIDTKSKNVSARLAEIQKRAQDTGNALQLALNIGGKQFSSLEDAIDGTKKALVDANLEFAKFAEKGQNAPGSLRESRNALSAQLNLLTEAQKARNKIGEINAIEEEQRGEKLFLNDQRFRLKTLAEEEQNLNKIISAKKIAGEVTDAENAKLSNTRIERERIATDIIIASRRQELDALAAHIRTFEQLRLQPLADLDKQDPAVLDRRLLQLRQLATAEQQQIARNLQLELESIDKQAEREGSTAKEVAQQKQLAIEKAKQESATSLQKVLQEATPIEQALGDKRGVRSLVDDFSRQLETAARSQSLAIDVHLKVGDIELDKLVRAVELGLQARARESKASVQRRVAAPSVGLAEE